MITLCIRYTIDMHKLKNFEQYARKWPEPIRRCGGELVGYFLPTKIAGPTNFALALINFPSLAAYEKYRAALMRDAEAKANFDFAENSGCILVRIDSSWARSRSSNVAIPAVSVRSIRALPSTSPSSRSPMRPQATNKGAFAECGQVSRDFRVVYFRLSAAR